MGGVAGAGKTFLAKVIYESLTSSFIITKYTSRPPRIVNDKCETHTDMIFSCDAKTREKCSYVYVSQDGYWYGFIVGEIEDALKIYDNVVINVRSAKIAREMKNNFNQATSIYVFPIDDHSSALESTGDLTGRQIDSITRINVKEREFVDFIAHYESFDYIAINNYDSQFFTEQLFKILERVKLMEILNNKNNKNNKTQVFISHGHSPLWYPLKDYINNEVGIETSYFEKNSNTGKHIVDLLSSFLEISEKAIIVMTTDDEMEDGKQRARQNVVHEAGLFQGRLGFKNVAIVLEEGVEEFGNIYGLQQIRFPKGSIKSCFHEEM